MNESPRPLARERGDRTGRHELTPTISSQEKSKSQEESNARVLEFAQKIQRGEAREFDFLDTLPNEVTGNEEKNPWEEAYAAIYDVARQHPELTQHLGEMAGMISQNPQMLHPAHLIDIAADVMWDPRIDSYLKGNMIHGLGYTLRFMESSEYEKAITSKLDFSHVDRFSDTAHFLEFMQNLYNIGDDYSYGDSIVISRVHNALRDAVEKEKGSYLLNVRAQELLAEMDGSSWVGSGFDRVPFMITKDRYARHKEDGLYISAPEERANIEKLIQEFQAIEMQLQPPQHLIDEALERGETEVWWTPDQQLMRARNTAYTAIDAAFADRLTYAEFSPEGGAVSENKRLVEEHDFAYLQRKPVRETIKNDFEIEIGNLSIQDQYKLLRVLKAVEYGKATPLLVEATRTLWKSKVKNYLDDIRGGAMEIHPGDLTEDDENTIIANLELQYKGKYPEDEMEELRQALRRACKSPDSRFYIYRKDGEIVTSVRFDRQSEGGVYMGSFITNPKYGGGAMGQALLEVALQKEATSGPIHAVCDPELVPFYEKFGFKLLRSYHDDHGVETCEIVLESGSASLRDAA